MLAQKTEILTHSFLEFAHNASHIIHIKTKNDYEKALNTIESLFEQAKDLADDPLNDLIDLISRAIEKYESKQANIFNFVADAKSVNHELSVLRVLMDQHNLKISDFKDEIGSKSLVSMILSGKRNLTKEHISTLSKRFNIDPALFFDLRVI
jgi:HTH-type transcriptional regulator/antitoxin HigA